MKSSPSDYSQGRQRFIMLTLLFVAAGCSPPKPTSSETSPDRGVPSKPTQIVSSNSGAPYSAHVAFAGGGWRAHTGHSGWTMSLLNNGSLSLNDAFANIETISSNSGGSWFSTMLTYSDSFVSAIEAKNAIQTWPISNANATGWLGQQQYLFDQAPCHILEGNSFLACVFRHYTGSLDDATYWQEVVEDIVFQNNMISARLNGKRQAWAKDKPLLLAATMLTNEAVLGQTGLDFDKQYYQACLSPSKPQLDGDNGASCVAGGTDAKADVTPVTFSSVPSGSGAIAPPFFSAAVEENFNVGYTENSYESKIPSTAIIGNPINSEVVPVMIAASASSAAAGFAASKAVTGSWEESYLGSDEALNFQLEGGIKYVKANGIKAKDLAAAKAIQIADGGAADNSAVAQLVAFLQQNNKAEDFNIIAFDNVIELYAPSSKLEPISRKAPLAKAPKVGIDIANLFGKGLWKGDQICSGSNGTGSCVTAPNLAIFDSVALTETSFTTWSAKAGSNDPIKKLTHELIYTKYTVTTVDNAAFSIKAGTTGTLHAFTAIWSDADTAPQNVTKDGDFKSYADMLNFINVGLQKADANGNTGLKYLRKAFGI